MLNDRVWWLLYIYLTYLVNFGEVILKNPTNARVGKSITNDEVWTEVVPAQLKTTVEVIFGQNNVSMIVCLRNRQAVVVW